MWLGTLSERGGESWSIEWPMPWSVVTLPEDRYSFTGALCDGYGISAETRNPETAWLWVSFLSRQYPPHTMPARRSLVESPAFEAQVGSDVAAVARESLDGMVVITPELLSLESEFALFGRALQDIIEGKTTVREALSDAQENLR